MKISDFNNLEKENVSHNEDVKRQRFLHDGDLPGLTNFSRAFFEAGMQVEPHLHEDMNEVFYVLQGRGEIMVDLKSYKLSPGVSVVVEAGERHQILAETSLELLYFGLESKA